MARMGRTPTRTVISKEVRRQAHEKFLVHTDEALQTLLEIMHNGDADHGHRISAAKEILVRAYGQAPTFANVVTETQRDEKPLISEDAIRALTDEQLTQYAQLTRTILNADANTIEHTPAEISSED